MNNHKELSQKHFNNVEAPYAFELLTPREQKLAKFFNAKSVDWIKAWSAGDGDFSDNKDAIVWGIALSDMLTIAMRVLRHKTGAMPIPELEKSPLPRPDPTHDILMARVKSLDESLHAVEVKAQSCRHLLDDIIDRLK